MLGYFDRGCFGTGCFDTRYFGGVYLVEDGVFHLEGRFEEMLTGTDRLAEGAYIIFHFSVGCIIFGFYDVHVCVKSMSMLVVHVLVEDDVDITCS